MATTDRNEIPTLDGDQGGRTTPGRRFRDALAAETPLQIVGTINAYAAKQAEQAGFRAIYLSGAGVANASYGLPDLGVTNLEDVLIDVRRITQATRLPLLADVDTGFGGAFNIRRTIVELIRAGAAACHLEDQVAAKRCGHRPGKQLVDVDEMCDRVVAAVDARDSAGSDLDPDFTIIARTDARADEGLDRAIERSKRYAAAGADAIFAEALASTDEFRLFAKEVGVPILANLTEFGKTPTISLADLRGVGVAMALYPLSAFRAMAKAAESVYDALRVDGDQRRVIDTMQTRERLYVTLDYHQYERKLDDLFRTEKHR